jgi:leucyl-tRNA synthetase
MATSAVDKALESLVVSKTKELKGVRERVAQIVLLPAYVELAQTEKRDSLVAIEKKYQQKWEEDKVFQPDAPTTSEVPLHSVSAAELRGKYPKFFACMAYP